MNALGSLKKKLKKEEDVVEEKPISPAKMKKTNLPLYSSGSVLLDCALGGGWCLGRMENIIGDFSTGKTLLAMEAVMNFSKTFPKGKKYYFESEAAFDLEYAKALGINLESVCFVRDVVGESTIEAFFEHVSKVIDQHKKTKEPAIYVVDSLDAMSDRSELERSIDEGSYALQKQKKLGEFFRRKTTELEETRINLIIVSQIRENIGVSFGNKSKRTGGKAMDFYASRHVWLSNKGKIKKTIKKVSRTIGINVQAEVRKNKLGPPFRDATFPLYFNYGIHDVESMVMWLESVGHLEPVADIYEDIKLRNSAYSATNFSRSFDSLESLEKREEVHSKLKYIVEQKWISIEESFLPARGKY